MFTSRSSACFSTALHEVGEVIGHFYLPLFLVGFFGRLIEAKLVPKLKKSVVDVDRESNLDRGLRVI